MRRLATLAVTLLLSIAGVASQDRITLSRLEATQEFRPPTTASCSSLTRQREADFCWDTDNNILYVYNGTAWQGVIQLNLVDALTWGDGTDTGGWTWTFDVSAPVDWSFGVTSGGEFFLDRANDTSIAILTLGAASANAGSLKLQDSDGSNSVQLRAAGTTTGDYIISAPAAAGSANTIVATTGSGNLAFTTATIPVSTGGIVTLATASSTQGVVLWVSGTTACSTVCSNVGLTCRDATQLENPPGTLSAAVSTCADTANAVRACYCSS